jgi:hypothetical protein
MGGKSSMKTQQLRGRLQKERPMATISIRMPEDVVEDLKRVAPFLGFLGISAAHPRLLRACCGRTSNGSTGIPGSSGSWRACAGKGSMKRSSTRPSPR